MKISKTHFKILLLIPVLLIVHACDSPVVFTNAQPPETDDLIEIPDEFHGTYITDNDNSIVIIDNHLIYTQHTDVNLNPVRFHAEKEECYLLEDSTTTHNHKICYNIDYLDKGMIVSATISKDTLFQFGAFQKARLYEGQMIVSQFSTDALWYVAVLSIDENDGLLYRSINHDSDLDLMAGIVELSPFTSDINSKVKYKVAVSEMQWEQLLEDPQIFVQEDYLRRLRFIN